MTSLKDRTSAEPFRTFGEVIQVTELDEERVQKTTAKPAKVEDGPNQSYSVRVAVNEHSRNPWMDLDLKGVDFTNYRKNPVVLWVHDDGSGGLFSGGTPSGGLPIGQALRIGREEGSIVAEFEFLPNDDFAARVKNAWEQGFLRGASIRWLPLEVTDRGPDQPMLTTKADMLEFSLVSIPADPDTLALAARTLNVPEQLLQSRQPDWDEDDEDDEEPEQPEQLDPDEEEPEEEPDGEVLMPAAVERRMDQMAQRLSRVEQELGIDPTAERQPEPVQDDEEDLEDLTHILAGMAGRFKE